MRCRDFELIKYFERHNIYVINSLESTLICCDKLIFHEKINRSGIDFIKRPNYLVADDSKSYIDIARTLGSPFVMKDVFGKKGDNVFLVSNADEFSRIKQLNKEFLCEEYINSSTGRDLRFYIIDGKIAGVMERVNKNDWRSNISQGGEALKFKPNSAQKRVALEVARVVNGDIISVDFLFGEKGELVLCEANSNAGYYGFNKLGVKIVDKIAKFLKAKLKAD